jgi:hypothetical protein
MIGALPIARVLLQNPITLADLEATTNFEAGHMKARKARVQRFIGHPALPSLARCLLQVKYCSYYSSEAISS